MIWKLEAGLGAAMGLVDLVKIQIRTGVLVIFSLCLVALTTGSADAAGGSWGSAAGGLGLFGGSWGAGGGLIGGRAPARNLLGRLNSRAANLGNGSSGVLLSGGLSGRSPGGFVAAGSVGNGQFANGVLGGSRGGLLGNQGGLLGTRLGNGLLLDGVVGGLRGVVQGLRNGRMSDGFGSVGGGYGYYGGSVGGYGGLSGATSYGSLGSSIAPTYLAAVPAPTYNIPQPTYVAPTYAAPTYAAAPTYVAPTIAPSYALPSYDLPSYDYSSFSVASPLANCVVEQSYPVGDYGFEPGYPVQEYSSPLDFGYPLDSSFSPGLSLSGVPVESGFPLEGFSTGGFPVDGFSTGGFPIDGFSSGGFPIDGFSSGGFPVEGSIVGESIPGVDSFDSTTILDGGSIDSMLDTSGAPLDTGLQLNPQTPSDGSEYYDGPGEGPANPFGEPGLPGPAEEDGTFIDRPAHETKAVLNLILPKHAKVLINGKATKTRGARRSYVSRHLQEDRDYKYQIKAIVTRGGKKTVRTKMVTMRPGVNQTVNLDFDDPVTTLALKVPVDAKVKLCGKTTQQTGVDRSFTTTSLAEGKTWKAYKVSVEYVVDGKKRVEERTLDLQAGREHELAIGVDAAGSQFASN